MSWQALSKVSVSSIKTCNNVKNLPVYVFEL